MGAWIITPGVHLILITINMKIQDKRPKVSRGKHQFELHSIPPRRKDLKEAYDWCLENLPLKEDKGIVYNVTEVYIITSSQRLIDKINKHFGSNFSFENFFTNDIYYI